MTDIAPAPLPFVAVTSHHDGDNTRPGVRIVVSPAAGVFEPTLTAPGRPHVFAGGEIGRVVGPGRSEPVHSFCDGALMRLLAEPGERVRDHQPLAWLEPIDPALPPTST